MKRKKAIIIAISILTILFFSLGLFIGLIINKKEEMNSKKNMPETTCIEKKTKTLEEIRKYENIVFLGDSITDYFPTDEIFLNLPIVNSGVAGYKTEDIIKELDTLVYQYNPTSVYLLIGTNDFMIESDDNQIDKVEHNIVEIVENIKKNRKNTKIYIESIYPVNKSIRPESVADRDNEEIIEVNKFLKIYCKQNNYIYIDMYKYLADSEGNLYKKYTNDGLHANEIGYGRISQVLLEYLYDIDV